MSSNNILLRPADSAAEDFLLTLFNSVREQELALANIDTAQMQMLLRMQFRAQQQQFSFAYPNAVDQIIILNDEPIGRMLVDRGAREFTLVDITLLPKHRGKGIGTRLLERLIDEAQSAEKSIRLHVMVINPAARLYQRLGFVQAGVEGIYLEMIWSPTNSDSRFSN